MWSRFKRFFRVKHLERVSVGDRTLDIRRRDGLFSRHISLSEGGKSLARFSYSVRGSRGKLKPPLRPLLTFTVPEELRGKKIASKMVDHALDDMKARGVTEVHVELMPEQGSEDAVRKLFMDRGFKREGAKVLSGVDEHALVSAYPVQVVEKWVWRKE